MRGNAARIAWTGRQDACTGRSEDDVVAPWMAADPCNEELHYSITTAVPVADTINIEPPSWIWMVS